MSMEVSVIPRCSRGAAGESQWTAEQRRAVAGALPAGRDTSGYRVYGEDAVERPAFIRAAKHLGLPLEEIGELLTVWEGACAEVKAGLLAGLFGPTV